MNLEGKAIVDATLEARIIRADGTIEELGVIARMPHPEKEKEVQKKGFINMMKGWLNRNG